ncbi:hypothetical protein A2U01_0092137, partial [Trifolium medium]|nr:hypothetical protein [Trifolium medium]
MVEDEEDEQEE